MIFETGGTKGGVAIVATVAGATVVAETVLDPVVGSTVEVFGANSGGVVANEFVVDEEPAVSAAEATTCTAEEVGAGASVIDEHAATPKASVTTIARRIDRRFRRRAMDVCPLALLITLRECRRSHRSAPTPSSPLKRRSSHHFPAHSTSANQTTSELEGGGVPIDNLDDSIYCPRFRNGNHNADFGGSYSEINVGRQTGIRR